MDASTPRIAIVGSVNLDLVARAPRLPAPGETVTGAQLARYPGGKGANQALAVQRLGGAASLFAEVGEDAEAQAALALLRAEGVDLTNCRARPGTSTGVALIVVSPEGENQITVAPGANETFRPAHLDLAGFDAVLCQLEVPDETVAAAAEAAEGLFCISLAPYRPLPRALLARADLLVMNQGEALAAGDLLAGHPGLQAITLGADGARLVRGGEEISAARAPAIEAVDATGAGDAFTAALVMEWVRGSPPEQALTFACSAGAAAAQRVGAQPALPTRTDISALESNTHATSSSAG